MIRALDEAWERFQGNEGRLMVFRARETDRWIWPDRASAIVNVSSRARCFDLCCEGAYVAGLPSVQPETAKSWTCWKLGQDTSRHRHCPKLHPLRRPGPVLQRGRSRQPARD
jgi:hypothetical protein